MGGSSLQVQQACLTDSFAAPSEAVLHLVEAFEDVHQVVQKRLEKPKWPKGRESRRRNGTLYEGRCSSVTAPAGAVHQILGCPTLKAGHPRTRREKKSRVMITEASTIFDRRGFVRRARKLWSGGLSQHRLLVASVG